MELALRWVREDLPGPRWEALARRSLPGCLAWYAGEGPGARPDLAACRAALVRHMPALVGTWEALVARLGGDPLAARMLSCWCPPRFEVGCSQAVRTRERPLLVRNYDYDPSRFEGAFLGTRWTGTRVVATSDLLWGALDGVNEHGLAAALAYGGRRALGEGFGIPLVVRLLLETCRTTAQAIEALRRVPVHMAYNVSLLDASGEHAVCRVAPDRPLRLDRTAVATNHQEEPPVPLDDLAARSLTRERHLARLLERPDLDDEGFTASFLEPPLHAVDHRRGHGTLYTVAYDAAARSAEWRWPGLRVRQSCARFRERGARVRFPGPAPGDERAPVRAG